MLQSQAIFNVRKASLETSVMDIQGEVNAYAENVLMEAYAKASQEGVKKIILNFKELQYMNSAGIGLLVTIMIRAQRNGQHLFACGLNEHYRNIFELTRLNEVIQFCGKEEEALSAMEN